MTYVVTPEGYVERADPAERITFRHLCLFTVRAHRVALARQHDDDPLYWDREDQQVVSLHPDTYLGTTYEYIGKAGEVRRALLKNHILPRP